MTLQDRIIRGEYDASLDALYTAVVERRKLVHRAKSAVTLAEIKVGDKVRLKDIRPKYMIGEVCVVTGKKQTKLVVKLAAPVGRFSGLGELTVPASCVELVPVGFRFPRPNTTHEESRSSSR